MKVLFARLVQLSLLSALVAAPVLMPGSVSASYQSTNGGFEAIGPDKSMRGIAGPELTGVSPPGIHGEIPVLSGTDLKGEPSILDQDWIASTVQDIDERDFVVFATDPDFARGSADSEFSGWIAATVVFVAFQILYATIKLGNWLAYAERDRPLGTSRRSQNARSVRRRGWWTRLCRKTALLVPRRSLATGARRRV